MQKTILILVLLFVTLPTLFAQQGDALTVAKKDSLTVKGDTLLATDNFTLRYFFGASSFTAIDMDTNYVDPSVDVRLALRSQYRFTENFGVNFDIMGSGGIDQNSDFQGFVFVSYNLFYNLGKNSFSLGKTASPITRFRPYPISAVAMAEYVGTRVITANNYTFNASRKIGKHGSIMVGAANMGMCFGDTMQYSAVLGYKGFSAGMYHVNDDYGYVGKYVSDAFETFVYHHKNITSGYVQTRLSEKDELYLALDWAVDRTDTKKFCNGKDQDYGELFFFKLIEPPKGQNRQFSGMYGLGATMVGKITVYTIFTF